MGPLLKKKKSKAEDPATMGQEHTITFEREKNYHMHTHTHLRLAKYKYLLTEWITEWLNEWKVLNEMSCQQ